MSDEVCGEARPHFSIAPPPLEEVRADPVEEGLPPEDDGSDIEIVERFEDFELSEHLLELVPPPLESGPMPLETLAAMAGAIAREHERLERRKSEAEVDAEAQADADADADAEEPNPEPPPPLYSDVVPCDAYCTLLRAMEDVAREGGAALPPDFAAALETDDVARAWAAVLRGESEDFSVCGASPLDEWAANVLAARAGMPSRAAVFRRDLRARGVAAFGLIEAA